MAVNRNLTERGLRALDAVKHCGYAMDEMEKSNDERMRNLPPNEWTEDQVSIAESTDKKINHH